MDVPYASDPKDVELESLIARRIRPFCSNVHVSAKGGHVTISGLVEDFEDKRSAYHAALEVAGVHDVTNNIRVAATS
ncbi:MAG TPA: BON domain-containing protein [bacterium]|nr:BON domain-containing protein [bacterium]